MQRATTPGVSKPTLRAIIALQNRIIASGLRLEAVMAAIVRELPALLTHANGAVIEIRDADAMVYRAASGPAARSIGLRLPMSASLSGLCVTTQTPLYAADVDTDDRVERDACRRLGIRSMICYPLCVEDECLGVCKAFATTPHAFTPSDMETMELVASVLAASLRNATQFEEVLSAVRIDRLTGLGNRRAFDEDIEHRIAQARRSSEALAIALIDLNNFKQLNDTFGHAAGDAALANFGEAISRNVRAGDEAYRIGGDEFCIVFPRATLENGTSLLAHVRSAIGEISVMGQPLSFSAGLAVLAPHDTATTLLERADEQMYKEKSRGRRSTPIISGTI